MHPRAQQLIALLQLEPHPEGGFYRRIYSSEIEIRHPAIDKPRPALTAIYYLLPHGHISRWHRVSSDEIWHFYEGGNLELFQAAPDFSRLQRHQLGPLSENARPAQTIPANSWQAARPLGDYTLVGCTVAPGFDYADFQLLHDLSTESATLQHRHENTPCSTCKNG